MRSTTHVGRSPRAWRALVLGVACFALLVGCATLPEPGVADASWAAQRWPGMSLEHLQAGRKLYVEKCSGCHVLKSPDALAPAQWANEVSDMRKKMGDQLSDQEAELIVRYLTTTSRRGASAQGEAPAGAVHPENPAKS